MCLKMCMYMYDIPAVDETLRQFGGVSQYSQGLSLQLVLDFVPTRHARTDLNRPVVRYVACNLFVIGPTSCCHVGACLE